MAGFTIPLPRLLASWSTGTITIGLSIVSYLLLVRSLRFRRRDKLEKIYSHLLSPDGSIKKGVELNPLDAQKIFWTIVRYERPWAMGKAIEFALFKTYGIPSIAALLCATTELSSRKTGGKRAEDTAVLFQEFIQNPLDSERSRLAIARTNYLHSHHGNKISFEDIKFTYAACVVEPVRWFARFEWMPATPLEKHALMVFWREVGRRMGVPAELEHSTYDELEEWYEAYDASHAVYSPQSHELAETTIAIMLKSVRFQFLHPTVRKVIIFSMGERLRLAMGMEPVSNPVGTVVQALFDVRNFFIKHFTLPRFSPRVRPNSYEKNAQGKYNRWDYTFEPYYIPTSWAQILRGYLLYGLIPSRGKYLSDGYVITDDLGPERYRGKGGDEVKEMAAGFSSANKAARAYGCPFAF